MAILPQPQLFSWKEIEDLGDLERLALLLKHLPDEPLMRALEAARGRGRNDYPVRAMWNSVLAGIVYQHPSVASLRRELRRNAQLRYLCGFDLLAGLAAVPSANAYSNFLRHLLRHAGLIDELFVTLVNSLADALPGFGRTLALDSKAINSLARRQSRRRVVDGRSEADADLGIKTYKGTRRDGSVWEKVVKWFGFKLHLLVDADYELPVAYEVTRASANDLTTGKQMIRDLADHRPQVPARAEYLLGDKAYDDTDLITTLWDDHAIKPVVDIRDLWKVSGARLVQGQTNVSHDYQGTVFCHCPEQWTQRPMAFGGFEKDRGTLKYRCPAKHYGFVCAGRDRCAISDSLRIPIASNRRIFTPLARSSYRWKRLYKKRSAVERVNSRLDTSFGFEKHFVRGLAKMRLQCGLALVVMLGMAWGRVRSKQLDRMRSLVTSIA